MSYKIYQRCADIGIFKRAYFVRYSYVYLQSHDLGFILCLFIRNSLWNRRFIIRFLSCIQFYAFIKLSLTAMYFISNSIH